MSDADAHFARVRLRAIELGKQLADPAFDQLALAHLDPLRDEISARLGEVGGYPPHATSARVARLRLDALLADRDLDDFGLVSLTPLREELAAALRANPTANMLAARGPAQTSLFGTGVRP